MTNRSNSERPDNSPSQKLLRASIIFAFAALFLIQLLITFRGLKSPDAMEQAQIARELARGNGFTTKLIRPFALKQLVEANQPADLLSLPNTSQPPLPSLILAPLFKALETHWQNTPSSRVYVLDRVVATLSLLFFIGSIGFSYLTIERLFDQRIAHWSALVMAVSPLLWEIATSALAPMMLLFFFTTTLFQLVLMHERLEESRSNSPWLILGIALSAACMVFTNWAALWLLPGLFATIALQPKSRALSILIILPVSAALLYWCIRNQTLTNDFLGVTKSTLQSLLSAQSHELAQRSYSIVNPIIDAKAVTSSFLQQSIHQLQHLYTLLGSSLPACLFFIALLHPFKKSSTSFFRISLFLMWLGAFIGMSITGISEDTSHQSQTHHLFIALFSAYGLAFLFVLWNRLQIGKQIGWIARHGIAAIALLITAMPMLFTLPYEINHGIRAKGMLSQWPPYLPDSLALLKPMFSDREVLISDIPWATAWYADRASLWLPKDRNQFAEIQTLATSLNQPLSGILFSPYSSQATQSINEALQNEYSDWSDHTYLASQIWHQNTQPQLSSKFPFREVTPLFGTYGRGGRVLLEMLLFTDRPRRDNPPTEPPSTTLPSQSEATNINPNLQN